MNDDARQIAKRIVRNVDIFDETSGAFEGLVNDIADYIAPLIEAGNSLHEAELYSTRMRARNGWENALESAKGGSNA